VLRTVRLKFLNSMLLLFLISGRIPKYPYGVPSREHTFLVEIPLLERYFSLCTWWKPRRLISAYIWTRSIRDFLHFSDQEQYTLALALASASAYMSASTYTSVSSISFPFSSRTAHRSMESAFSTLMRGIANALSHCHVFYLLLACSFQKRLF